MTLLRRVLGLPDPVPVEVAAAGGSDEVARRILAAFAPPRGAVMARPGTPHWRLVATGSAEALLVRATPDGMGRSQHTMWPLRSQIMTRLEFRGSVLATPSGTRVSGVLVPGMSRFTVLLATVGRAIGLVGSFLLPLLALGSVLLAVLLPAIAVGEVAVARRRERVAVVRAAELVDLIALVADGGALPPWVTRDPSW